MASLQLWLLVAVVLSTAIPVASSVIITTTTLVAPDFFHLCRPYLFVFVDGLKCYVSPISKRNVTVAMKLKSAEVLIHCLGLRFSSDYPYGVDSLPDMTTTYGSVVDGLRGYVSSVSCNTKTSQSFVKDLPDAAGATRSHILFHAIWIALLYLFLLPIHQDYENDDDDLLVEPAHNAQPSTANQEAEEYRVIIVGDEKTGKTTFLERIPATFTYVPNVEDEDNFYGFDFQTTKGSIFLNCFDYDRGCNTENLSSVACMEVAIIMIDVTRRGTLKSLKNWIYNLTRWNVNIPIIVVGNKIDAAREVHPIDVIEVLENEYPYIELSALGNYQVGEVFLSMIHKIKDDPTIEFAPAPIPVRAQFELNTDAQLSMELEYEAAKVLRFYDKRC